jgi:hypothetical protein
MSRGTKWLIGCLVGGCATIVVLGIIGVVAGGLIASRFVDLSAGAKLPGDFPVYPGARQQTAITVKAKDGDPTHSVTLIQWRIAGGGSKVRTWYRDHLNQGDWEIVSEGPAGTRFRRKSTGAEDLLLVRDQLAQTIVQLEVTGDQPLERGAHPVLSPVPEASP